MSVEINNDVHASEHPSITKTPEGKYVIWFTAYGPRARVEIVKYRDTEKDAHEAAGKLAEKIPRIVESVTQD